MRTLEEAKTATAAIVGRFQVPSLHGAHRALFDSVLEHHQRVLILIGINRVLGGRDDPLDFIARKNMIEEAYPQVTCLPLADIPGSDEAWSRRVDDTIHQIAPIGPVTLYGGRDSFVKHYTGKFQTVELDAFEWETGTDIRRQIGRVPLTTEGERRGVIYLAENQYPRVHPVVDIAILRPNGPNDCGVVLGQRTADVATELNWRFPGGFADARDAGYEATARREAGEETGASIEGMEYVCSRQVVDDRLSHGDAMMTILYKAPAVTTGLQAGDDFAKVEWFDLQNLSEHPGTLYQNHLPLLEALLASQ